MKNHLKKTIALDRRLTTYHLKILLLLDLEEYSQKELSMMLNICKQHINKYVKELENWSYIEVSEKVGNVKYLKILDNYNLEFKGQIKLL